MDSFNNNDINNATVDSSMQNGAMQEVNPNANTASQPIYNQPIYNQPVIPQGAYQPPKKNKFAEILLALVKCAGYIFVWLGVQTAIMLVLSVVVALTNPNLSPTELTDKLLGYSIELTVASNIIALAIYFLIFFIARKSLLKKINIDLPHKLSYAPTAIIGTTGQLVTGLALSMLMMMNLFPQKWIDQLNENSDLVTNANPYLSFFAVVILAPLFEEILCRGLILNTLRKTMPKWCAIVLSSAIFGIIHGNPIQFIYATALGIILGWLYTKFDSIWVPILCHLTFNLASTLLGYLPQTDIASVIIGLLTFASIPIFTLAIIYVNLKSFKKKPIDVSVNQPVIPYQYNNAPEYNASVVRNLENEIEGKNKNSNNKE